jgi:hypothetical protein
MVRERHICSNCSTNPATAVNRGELFCFLTKPWDDAELVDTVRDAFRHHESRRQSSK